MYYLNETFGIVTQSQVTSVRCEVRWVLIGNDK